MSNDPDTTELELQIAALIRLAGDKLRRKQPATKDADPPLQPAHDAAPVKENER
jgi:hypothetical protein